MGILSVPSLELYCDGTQFVAIEESDLLAPVGPLVSGSPRQTIVNVFEGSLAISPKYMGNHVHNYINISSTTPRPEIPFGCLRTHDVRMHWPDIETSAGVYNWTIFDQFVAWAESIGAEVCHTLAFTPSFYASNLSVSDQYGRAGGSSMPTPVSAWTNYVTACATRYAGRVKYYEVWNEPNYRASATVGTFFGTEANMVTLAAAAYSAIKAADPSAIVLSPCPVGETPGSFGQKSITQYFTDYWAAGGGAHCDEISWHAYLAFNRDPSFLPTYTATVRAVADAAGLSAKPMTCSETGNQEVYFVNGQRVMGDPERARYMARCMIYLAATGQQRCYWYDYDGGFYGAVEPITGRRRMHGMIDPATKAETIQCEEWRRLAGILPGSTLLRVNRCIDGRVGVVTSRGSAVF